jgi:hypothetical protein
MLQLLFVLMDSERKEQSTFNHGRKQLLQHFNAPTRFGGAAAA